MFAPKLAKPQTTAADSLPGRLAPHRSMFVGHQLGHDIVEKALFLQRTIGKQATLRLPRQQQTSHMTGNGCGPHEQNISTQECTIARVVPRGASLDFSKIPLYPPDIANHSRTPKSVKPEIPKLAQNLDESPPPIEDDLLAAPSLVQLDAPAFKERDASANSTMRVTTTFAGDRPSFTDKGFGVLCQSPPFALAGQVSVPAARANGDMTLGFMQALVNCTGPKGIYYDDSGAPYMSAFQPYATLPVKDGADPSDPFYGPEAQQVVDSPSVSVSMSDRPQGALLWTTPDKKGTLQQIVGEQDFVTWLATKSDSTGRVEPLRFISWSVDWYAAVDQPGATPFGVGRITDAGGGEGPIAPIRSGPLANSSVQPSEWKPLK